MYKNSKGFSPIILILVVLLVLGGGYFFLSKSGTVNLPGTSNLIQRATEKDFEFVKDPLVKKHFVAQANQGSFRTKNISSGRGEDVSVSEVEIKGENFNYGLITQDKSGKEKTHLIVIGDTTYVKDYKDNKWWKQVAKKEEVKDEKEQEAKPQDFKEEFSKKKDVEYKQLGTELCDSFTCYKYQEIDPENKEGKRTFWFDNQNYLLRKEEYTFGEFTTTVAYSYDNISIDAPSETKDVPEGKNIYEYLYYEYLYGDLGIQSAPSSQEMKNAQQELQKFQQQTQITDIPQDTSLPQDVDY